MTKAKYNVWRIVGATMLALGVLSVHAAVSGLQLVSALLVLICGVILVGNDE
ncbi:hypothetical protein ES703_66255 [subsurface metagenome]